MANYETPVVLGEKYRDKQTDIEGTAIAVTFWQHSCERVIIERVNPMKGELEELTFDRPRLVPVEPAKAQPERVHVPSNGGPGGSSRDRSAVRGGAR